MKVLDEKKNQRYLDKLVFDYSYNQHKNNYIQISNQLDREILDSLHKKQLKQAYKQDIEKVEQFPKSDSFKKTALQSPLFRKVQFKQRYFIFDERELPEEEKLRSNKYETVIKQLNNCNHIQKKSEDVQTKSKKNQDYQIKESKSIIIKNKSQIQGLITPSSKQNLRKKKSPSTGTLTTSPSVSTNMTRNKSPSTAALSITSPSSIHSLFIKIPQSSQQSKKQIEKQDIIKSPIQPQNRDQQNLSLPNEEIRRLVEKNVLPE